MAPTTPEKICQLAIDFTQKRLTEDADKDDIPELNNWMDNFTVRLFKNDNPIDHIRVDLSIPCGNSFPFFVICRDMRTRIIDFIIALGPGVEDRRIGAHRERKVRIAYAICA